jgi:hypothetical protein
MLHLTSEWVWRSGPRLPFVKETVLGIRYAREWGGEAALLGSPGEDWRWFEASLIERFFLRRTCSKKSGT